LGKGKHQQWGVNPAKEKGKKLESFIASGKTKHHAKKTEKQIKPEGGRKIRGRFSKRVTEWEKMRGL